MLSPQQQDGYQTDGYLVLPGFKPAHELAALRKRALQIVEAFDQQAHQDIFSTQDQARRSAGRNFLALLVCAGRRHAGQRLPVGAAGRPPQPAARALRARRRPVAHGQAQ